MLSACASSEHIDGQLPSKDKLDRIEVGVFTKEDVKEVLGTPSTRPAFGDSIWYYIRRITQQVAFLDPVLIEQQVVAIGFDDKDVVDEIFAYSEDDAHNVILNERETPTQGRKLTFWEQIFSNYGKLPDRGSETENSN